MAKIRKLRFFDILKIKKMISVLGAGLSSSYSFSPVLLPLNLLSDLLPIKLKKMSESYVSIENKKLNGMLCLQAQRGNPFKWRITKLILDKNSYEAGQQLVDFAISKYGAYGVNTFCVNVDHNHDELLMLFSKGCGFRFCSHEQLWKMNDIVISNPQIEGCFFRPYKKLDALKAAKLYNESIFPHFRYSMAKTKSEFNDPLFSGLSRTSSFKFIIEEEKSQEIRGFLVIYTNDNDNFVLDITLSQAYESYYAEVISYAIEQITRRRKTFNIFIKNRKYQINSGKYEDYLISKSQGRFSCVENQAVLVKDFFKPIKENARINEPAIIFSEMGGKPAFKRLNSY